MRVGSKFHGGTLHLFNIITRIFIIDVISITIAMVVICAMNLYEMALLGLLFEALLNKAPHVDTGIAN